MPNEPSLGELSRALADFRADVKDDIAGLGARLDAYLLREVYLADKAANEVRVARLEREAEAARAAARTAIYGCIGAIIAAIVAGVLMAVMMKGGGTPGGVPK